MSESSRSPVVPEIERLVPYVPGKPISELKRELGLSHAIKLASNENPLGPSPRAREAIKKAAHDVHFYPDGGAYYLKRAIADHLHITPREVIVSNGSNEAIELIVRTFGRPGDRVLVSEETFIIYKLASIAAGFAVDAVPMREHRFDLEAMADALRPETRFVFIANPNNPTGTWVNRTTLTAFLERVSPDTIVVLDEAYFEFVDEPEYPDGMKLRARFPNLVVLRTFSKCYGLAGIRLGYGAIHSNLASYIDRVRAPFNTSHIAQRAGIAALSDVDFLARSVEHNSRVRAALAAGVTALGLVAVPSVTNFVLVGLPAPATVVFERLQQRGVIVRPMAAYGLPNHIRVSVGLDEEIATFLTELEAVLGELGA